MSNPTININAAPTKQDPPMSIHLDELDRELHNLENAINTLADRLTPVSSTDKQPEPGELKVDNRGTSAMLRFVASKTDQAYALKLTVERMTRELEI